MYERDGEAAGTNDGEAVGTNNGETVSSNATNMELLAPPTEKVCATLFNEQTTKNDAKEVRGSVKKHGKAVEKKRGGKRRKKDRSASRNKMKRTTSEENVEADKDNEEDENMGCEDSAPNGVGYFGK